MNGSFWKNKRVLVTGAGGFIGSHLTEALIGQGAQVKALVKYNSRNCWGHLESLSAKQRDRCEVILGDVTDSFAPRRWVEGCEIVFHLAALIAIPYSYTSPTSYANVNVQGTVNLLEACCQEKVSRLVHTSTSEVYGTALHVPIDESHPLQGQSPYAASKIAADKFAQSYHLSFGLPVIIARPFNTFGPRQSARAIIPTIITQALACESIALGAVEPVRDFVYVEDTVCGLMALAACDTAVGKVVNLGTGSGISIGQLAGKILSLTDKGKGIRIDPRRIRPKESEVMQLVCNTALATTLTGWQAETDLDEGLKRTAHWIGQHLAEYKVGLYVV